MDTSDKLVYLHDTIPESELRVIAKGNFTCEIPLSDNVNDLGYFKLSRMNIGPMYGLTQKIEKDLMKHFHSYDEGKDPYFVKMGWIFESSPETVRLLLLLKHMVTVSKSAMECLYHMDSDTVMSMYGIKANVEFYDGYGFLHRRDLLIAPESMEMEECFGSDRYTGVSINFYKLYLGRN